MDLRGAVALITGGNGGLGQRIGHALAREGAHVAVTYAQSKDQAEGVAVMDLRLGVGVDGRGILTRHAIPPERVLAHSDVAPARKQDPGEKFPWRTLHDSGVGHWVKPAPLTEEGSTLSPEDRGNEVIALREKALG